MHYAFELHFEDFAAWSGVSDVFREATSFEVPILSAPALSAVQYAWYLALLLSCLGLYTRASTVMAFLLGLYVLSVRNFVGFYRHEDATTVFVLFILAISRCGDRYSIDERRGRVAPEGEGPEYTWPIRLVWVFFACVFFSAGVSKLRHTGLAWVDAPYFEQSLALGGYHTFYYAPLTNWGGRLAEIDVIARAAAVGTLVVELGFPLALVSVWCRRLFVAAIVGMLLSVRVLIGPCFVVTIAAQIFWLPWGRLIRLLSQRWR